MEEKKKFADQVWFTRISRTKAEQRLINKERFIQFINIYYSLIAIICSILSYIYNDQKMGLFTIIITICLMVAILYLNGQKYLQQAKDYRDNYTQLHFLQLRALNEDSELRDLQKEYCYLLNSNSNHIEYDYLEAIRNSSEAYREQKDWKKKRYSWFWEVLWRFVVKVLVIVAPFGFLMLCEVFAK